MRLPKQKGREHNMSTTKRDFEAIAAVMAKAFERSKTDEEEAILLDVSMELADYFAGQNERFKREQFLASCGIEVVS